MALDRPSLLKSAEVLANLGIFVASIGFVLFLGLRFWEVRKPSAGPPGPPVVTAGQTFAILADQPSRDRTTLVFALDKDCRFCTASAPFYREVIEAAALSKISTLAILPHKPEESLKYLSSQGIAIQDVREAVFASLNIVATPMLLFVDGDGVVRRVFRGFLNENDRTALLSEIQERKFDR